MGESVWRGEEEGRRGEIISCCYMVSKSTWCLMSTETIRLIRDGEKGVGGGEEGRRREIISYCYMVSELTWCLTSTETIRLIRDGEVGGGVRGGGGVGREIMYLPLHCPTMVSK